MSVWIYDCVHAYLDIYDGDVSLEEAHLILFASVQDVYKHFNFQPCCGSFLSTSALNVPVACRGFDSCGKAYGKLVESILESPLYNNKKYHHVLAHKPMKLCVL